jgi:hypothetical protein
MNRHTIFSQANRRRYLFAFLIYIAREQKKKLLLLRETLTLGSKYYFFLVYRNKFKNPTLADFQPFNSKAALVVDMRGGSKIAISVYLIGIF